MVEGLIERNVSDEAIAFVDELTKPKVGGGTSDVADYTVFDGETPTHIFCTYHKQWEPVLDEESNPLFKANEKAKNGYMRTCNDGEASWKEQAKVFKATKDAVISDLLEGTITNDVAKDLISDAEAARAEHAEREDGLGETERPDVQ